MFVALVTFEMNLSEEARQVTMTNIPHPDGGHRVALTQDLAKPPKTKM
jgi:hypothetical protein